MDTIIQLDLSPQGIERAIRKLEKYQRRIESRTEQLVDELIDGGTEMARYAFGSSADVTKTSESGNGTIDATAKNVIIMEFGAGLSTMEGHPLKHNAPVDVYKWSYSEQVGSGEGFLTEQWHFGGRVYSAVEPRHGMLDARGYIVNNLESKARTVFSR